MAEKLFKKDLAERLADEMDMTKKDAAGIIDFLAETIVEELAKGNTVTIKEIGKFSVTQKEAHTGINPKTLEKVEVPAKKAVTFRASKSLKDSIQ